MYAKRPLYVLTWREESRRTIHVAFLCRPHSVLWPHCVSCSTLLLACVSHYLLLYEHSTKLFIPPLPCIALPYAQANQRETHDWCSLLSTAQSYLVAVFCPMRVCGARSLSSARAAHFAVEHCSRPIWPPGGSCHADADWVSE